MKNIVKKLKQMKSRIFKCVKIVAGTNDVNSEATKEDILEKDFYPRSKMCCLHIHSANISTILPWTDKPEWRQKTICMNISLMSVAADFEVNVIDHDRNFVLKDGDVENSLLFPDGLHLESTINF